MKIVKVQTIKKGKPSKEQRKQQAHKTMLKLGSITILTQGSSGLYTEYKGRTYIRGGR